ncbi:hypothetical protein [Bosea sp. (in: a-proteobacteria)]|jgi:hypothetical protein|uniref:hypothetical protein n=1 Tax=Bosea sp. (in: a-proteobacteria) TaxID=1871050 RepID=UPI002DDD3594|nr:hypothetical protein [Bosea sp. (in: a-proteobacteria)]HEV2513279.1 hypothetical protein [Bosea sp. (in: a-proteobacteria)]
MAKLTEIASFGGQAASAPSFGERSTANSHEFNIILMKDGWAELQVTALQADVFVSPTNMKFSTWVNSDADDVSVKGKLKLRVPKDETRTFWFTASERVGGFHTTYLVTAPRAAHAKKTKITVGVM